MSLDVVTSYHRMRGQNTLNVPEPSIELAIPVDGRLERGFELCPLLPAKLVQFSAINSIPAVVEFPVVRVLDPHFHVRLPEQAEQLFGELHIRDFILRIDIVGLSDLAFVQDRVKSFRRITSVEVAARVLPVAVEQQWFATTEEVNELWYDLCVLLAYIL